MTNPLNKANLLAYLSTSWSMDYSQLPDDVCLILGGTFEDRSKALHIEKTSETSCLPELSCSAHEEADTRMYVYICSYGLLYNTTMMPACGSSGYTDTDIIVLCMYLWCRLDGPVEL